MSNVQFKTVASLWILGLSVLFVFGCSNDIKKYSVSGKFTYQGQPIEEGEVTFAPIDGKGRPDSAIIKNGEYQVSVTEGKKRVRVSAISTKPELVGPPPPDMPPGGINPPREYLPERYGEESVLEAEVLPKNGQTFNFDLVK